MRPDLVQIVLPWPDAALGPLLACALFRCPTAVTFQLTGASHIFEGRTLQAYLWAKSRRQRWVAVSDQNRRVLADAFTLRCEDFDRIYNGTRPQPEEPGVDPEARAAVRRELGLPPDAFLALGVGRLVPQKGFDLLPLVVPHLAAEFPRAYFAVAGDGPDRKELERRLTERGVAGRVRLLGRRPDVPRLLRAADLFVFPSRIEGHPFALVEALAAGVPVATSSASGISEIVTDRTDAVVFRPDDPCDFLEALRWALRHPGEMAEMGRRGPGRARLFTEARMVQETFALFAELCRVPTSESGAA